MANGGTVTVDFAVEVERANAGITQIIGKLEGFEKQLAQLNRASERHLKNVENRFESLDKMVRRATQAFSAVLVGQLVKSAADAADEFGKMADKLSISTERLKAFQIAADDAGVSAEATNKVLIDAQKRLGEAALGTGDAAKFIKLLGLNIQDLQRLSPDELFKVYSDSISRLSSRSEQLAAATGLMGKSAAEAFGLIQAGSPAIDEAAAFVEKFALALDRVSIRQIEQANDAITRLQLISKSSLQQFTAGLAPFVEELSRRIQEATGSTEGLRAAGAVAGATLQTALDLASNAANSAKAAFFGLAAVIESSLANLIAFSMKAVTLLETRQLFFSPEVQKNLAASIESATGALRLSANQNLENARESLAQVKTIEQIQAGIVASMEASRQKAEQSIAEQTAREAAAKAGGLSLQDPLGLTLQERADAANEVARGAAAEQARIARDLTAEINKEVDKRNEAERTAAANRIEMVLAAEREIRAAKATTADLAVSFLQALGQKNKAFAIASIVLEKAIAIQRLLIANQQAASLAFASQLVPGDPTSLARAYAAQAAVITQGRIQAALIAATGALQIADVTSGGGRSAVGTPLNPAFVTPAANAGTVGATSQGAIQVIIANNVGFDQRVMDQIIAGIREAADDRDVIIFGSESRQAKELLGG